MQIQSIYKAALFCVTAVMVSACSNSSKSNKEPESSNFTLNFKAMSGDLEVNCNDIYTDIGPSGEYSIGVGDLRFYVSNLKFYNANNEELTVTLTENDFQLKHPAGSVSLIDFTGKDSGFCAGSQLGTPRTNTVIRGTVSDDAITTVSFDVGVPQAVMKAVIASSSNLTDVPSPLAEMTWGWANGYRHIDFNFTVMNSSNTSMTENSGIHLGSKDCGTANKALSDQDNCGLLNTPKVMLNNFDPANNSVTFDISALLKNSQDADYQSMIMSEIIDGDDSACINETRINNKCPTGVKLGMLCHSIKTETSCVSAFPNLGLDLETGTADSNTNIVFGME